MRYKKFGGTIAVSAIMAFASLSGASAEKSLSRDELLKDLRSGGHLIFIRHASTKKDCADQDSAEMGDCSTQRTLSEDGRREARTIGSAFDLNEIPVAQGISSKHCRAWQTVDPAFSRCMKSPALNFEPVEEYSEAEMKVMRDRVTPYLSMVPPEGFNVALVGHDDPFDAATGIYPEPMGVT